MLGGEAPEGARCLWHAPTASSATPTLPHVPQRGAAGVGRGQLLLLLLSVHGLHKGSPASRMNASVGCSKYTNPLHTRPR